MARLNSEILQEFARRYSIFKQDTLHRGIKFHDAVVLSTSANNITTSRTVLMKSFSEDGFIFFTNLESRKGIQISQNPNVSLCFSWHYCGMQVIVNGVASKIRDEESDAYFMSRPQESQVASSVSNQSREAQIENTIQKRFDKLSSDITTGIAKLIRPKHWCGILVDPVEIEFWTEGPFRMHHRTHYHFDNSQWNKAILDP
jgi:pyridoxamine 5'-phosphate oxidase